jgi:ABC-type polar amino acid transport system ATPase subunit
VIKITHLKKNIGSRKIINDVSLEINKGDVIGLIGPGNSGKSVLLKCIVGIEDYNSGNILIENGYSVGMVFKDINLFENMSVIDNLCFSQERVLRRTRNEAEGLAMQMLKRFDMITFFDKSPQDLRAGDKQKISILRTLCMNPSIILFENPNFSIEIESIPSVFHMIRSLIQDGISAIILTNEIRFLKSIANRMIFMEDGVIQSDVNKDDFFANQPNNRIKEFFELLLSY